MAEASSKKKKIFDNRYEVLSIVGRGSRSVVYHARYIDGDQEEVALKVLLEKKGAIAPSDMLRKEALAMVSSRHKYVIRLDDFHSLGDICYLTMEYAPLGDLRKYLEKKGGKLSATQTELFLLQAGEALDFIHKAGILHRDIKPDNLLVVDDQNIRIGDFGVAILPGEKSTLEELQKGVGTMDYLSPETLETGNFDRRADLYALGVTFYQLLSGHHPFENLPMAEQIEARRNGRFTSIAKREPDAPSHLLSAIHKLMNFSPDKRFQTARELIQALISFDVSGLEEDNDSNDISNAGSSTSKPKRPLRAEQATAEAAKKKAEKEKAEKEAIKKKEAEEKAAATAKQKAEQERIEKEKTAQEAAAKEAAMAAKIEEVELKQKAAEIAETKNIEDTQQIESIEDKSFADDVKPKGKIQEIKRPEPLPEPEEEIEDILADEIEEHEDDDDEDEDYITKPKRSSVKRTKFSKTKAESNFSLSTIIGICATAFALYYLINLIPSCSTTNLENEKQIATNQSAENNSSGSLGQKATNANGNVDKIFIETPTEPLVNFPQIPGGIYAGKARFKQSGEVVPFSIISVKSSDLLIIALGLPGFSPVSVKISDLPQEQAPVIKVTSQGMQLSIDGRAENGMLFGKIVNETNGEIAEWTARP